jgi:hypothetical protein
MRIHIDAIQQKNEELYSNLKEYKNKNVSLNEKLNEYKKLQNVKENQDLIGEIENLKYLVKSYEERNLNITDLEKKLRLQQSKHEKEIKEIEGKYKERLREMTKKIMRYEEKLKISNNTTMIKENKTNENNKTELTIDNKDLIDRTMTNMRNKSLVSTERTMENIGKERKVYIYLKYRENKMIILILEIKQRFLTKKLYMK